LLYLHGATALLSDCGHDNHEAPMLFLIDLHDYICSIVAITSTDVPRPFCRKVGLTSPGASGIHPLFGIASDLYSSLARINQLALDYKDLAGTVSRSSQQHAFKSEVLAIELDLQGWSPTGGDDAPQDMAEARAAAFAVQWATILRLRELAPLDVKKDQTERPVDYIISALSLIRPGSRTEACMLFPIFMAGVCSTTKASRLTLDFRINLMKTTIGFGNIASAHQILNELWKRSNMGECCEWKELIRSSSPGMVLF
jgi:transcriptional activator protein UGA3